MLYSAQLGGLVVEDRNIGMALGGPVGRPAARRPAPVARTQAAFMPVARPAATAVAAPVVASSLRPRESTTAVVVEPARQAMMPVTPPKMASPEPVSFVAPAEPIASAPSAAPVVATSAPKASSSAMASGFSSGAATGDYYASSPASTAPDSGGAASDSWGDAPSTPAPPKIPPKPSSLTQATTPEGGAAETFFEKNKLLLGAGLAVLVVGGGIFLATRK